MRIFILGVGRMGSWLARALSPDNDVVVYDNDVHTLQNCTAGKKINELQELKKINPDLVINAVTLHKTADAFEDILPFISNECILSDITSVKTGVCDYYKKSKRKFVSTHPMFGPTFANTHDLKNENAILIHESDELGKKFFLNFFRKLQLNIYEYSFLEHDEVIAYSLSTPFTSSMVFAACMKKEVAPGTTFKKHHEIAEGLLGEDDYLLSEIMFSPHALKQIEKINSKLSYLTHIIRERDFDEMKKFLDSLRENIK